MNADGTFDTEATDSLQQELLHLRHSSTFMGTIKMFWLSQFVRYITRPRPWFVDSLKNIATARLRRITCEPSCSNVAVDSIEKPFASVHVRYGSKILEQSYKPLQNYMNFLTKKAKYVKKAFLSTETEWVIQALAESYPDFEFYYLEYDRIEQIDLGVIDETINYPMELVLSFANLYVAIEATVFVGSLTSSWCMLINQLERTRGDGGTDYWSVDVGSQFTTCF